MKAEPSSIPVETVKTEAAKQPQTTVPRGTDSLYALIRRLDGRIRALEETLSIVRRDVNRIDRAHYRKQDQPSVTNLPAAGPADFPAGLYGIE